MNKLLKLCCLIGAGILTAACSSTSGQQSYIAPEPEAAQNKQIEVLWRRGLSEDYPHSNVAPALGYEKLFLVENDKTVVALDAANGNTVWRYESPAAVTGGISAANQLIAFGTSEGDVIVLKADDGSLHFQTSIQDEILAKPLITAGYLVVQTASDTLLSFNMSNKEKNWVYAQDIPALSLRGTSSPTAANGAVIAAYANGTVAVYLLKEGFQAWQQRISQPSGKTEIQKMVDVDADPIVFGRVLYVASYQGHISALDLQSGRVLWQQKNSTYKNFLIDGFLLICTTAEGHIRAFDRRTGELQWEQEQLFGRTLTSPVVLNNQLVIGDYQGQLYWLDRNNGQLESKFDADGSAIFRNMIVNNNILYVYAESGDILALQSKSQQP